MATLCKNCAAPLVFDPATQRVVCHSCGSSWTAEEVESSEKEFVKDKHAVAAEEVYGKEGIKEEFIDCYIYTCSSCGGEVIINGTETSTKCIYCGSTSVVFDRISKEKAPEFIMPFQITKEKAVELIRERFSKTAFLPDDIKRFKPDQVHGIYVPYWLVDARHVEADIYSARFQRDKSSYETRYFGRSGQLELRNMPVDGSRMLSGKITQRLEPFDFSAIKNFDEDYLLGFYSNSSDISTEQLESIVATRCHDAFDEAAKKTVGGSGQTMVNTRQETVIDRDLKYCMLPVWFVTYKLNGFYNTVLINGQTGKMVGDIPTSRQRFFRITAITAASLSVLFTLILGTLILPAVFRSGFDNESTLYMICSYSTLFLLIADLYLVPSALKKLRFVQSGSLIKFAKKRQGGASL